MDTLISLSPDLGRELSALRTAAGLKQSDIATAMRIHPSAVSRIETGSMPPEERIVSDYLKAVGSEEARRLRAILERAWTDLPRPTVHHPTLDALLKATDDLRRITEFLDDPSVPKPLEGQARLLRDEILKAASYLAERSHSVAYIGDIGVGKTTAACFQVGLTRQTKLVRDLKEDVLLATGAGRTTICEVRVRTSDKFAILVEPIPDAEVYRLVAEFAVDLWDRREGKPPAGEDSRALTGELDRALRNMAGLIRRREKDDNGQFVVRDEGIEMAKGVDTLEDLRSAIAERLRLYKRTTRELTPDSSGDAEGRAWLRDTFYKINDGRHDAVSLPHRITVIVPFPLVTNAPLPIEIIDTKGIDQTAVRPDLRAAVDDPRCVSILCSRFLEAPGQSTNLLIGHLKETGSERAVEERALLLVLDRNEEARAMRDDETGRDVESVEEGRFLKKLQIEDALLKNGVNQLPIAFFNTMEDDAKILNEAICSRLLQMRERHATRLESLSQTIDTMIQNREHENALAAQREVNRRIEIFIEQNAELRNMIRHCQDSLLEQMTRTHARTLWASMRRSGSWPNFDVYFWLGAGASQDATLRSLPRVQALAGLISNMLGDTDLEPAHRFLEALKSSIEGWNAAFLETVRNVAAEVFRPALDDARAFWAECESEWGQGSGYRDRVHERIRIWFEDPDRQHLHRTLDQRMRRTWDTAFINPLREAINIGLPRNDELTAT